MKASVKLVLVVIMSAIFPVQAENKLENSDLPSLATVAEALSNNPDAQAARAGIEVGKARQLGLEAGPYEPNVRLGAGQRTIDGRGDFGEWDISLERAFRLPGKVRLDQQLGVQGVSQAEAAYADSLHEAKRELLRLWFNWMRAYNEADQAKAQVETFKEQLRIVERRVQGGDAPRLEASLAGAALAQEEYSLQQARLREQKAAIDLTQRFIGIQLPAAPTLITPVPITQTLDEWRARILTSNDELNLAREQSKRAQLQAARADKNQRPDPMLGARYASETGGDEQIAGVYVSIPLTGKARAAAGREATAEAEIANLNEAKVLRRLNADIASVYASAQSSYRSQQSALSAADFTDKNAELIARAYSLGEADLSNVLIARRQAAEARLAASLAQLDANEARYRLLVDAHELWPLEGDPH
ncbi:MAG: TolC family protein [Gammaproteobacteria bacterium]